MTQINDMPPQIWISEGDSSLEAYDAPRYPGNWVKFIRADLCTSPQRPDDADRAAALDAIYGEDGIGLWMAAGLEDPRISPEFKLAVIRLFDAENVIRACLQTPQDNGYVRVPVVPTEQHLVSMAYRYDHSFGVDRNENAMFGGGHTAQSRQAILTTMRQLYEEVVSPSYIAAAPATTKEEK